MAEHPAKRRHLRWMLALFLPLVVPLFCCGLGDIFWLGDDPLESVQKVQPLTSVQLPRNGPPHHYAADRDELVFINEGTQLEVYRIDARLTHLRTVPLRADGVTQFSHVSAFPRSPLAVIYGLNEGPAWLAIINTETGRLEKELTLPKAVDGLVTSVREVVVSPDERWLALELVKRRVEGGSDIQEGWRPATVVNYQSGESFELISPGAPSGTPRAFAFVGANTLFIGCSPPEHQLWDLSTRQLKWAVPADSNDQQAHEAISNGSQVIACSHSACRVLDVETGRVIRSHRGTRTAWAVGLHPNGDYIAGYCSHSYALFGSYLNGAVRIWDANGERRTTFLADQSHGWRGVEWLAISKAGDYLVTGCHEDVKVWDYHALPRR